MLRLTGDGGARVIGRYGVFNVVNNSEVALSRADAILRPGVEDSIVLGGVKNDQEFCRNTCVPIALG